MNKLLIRPTTWMNLKGIMLRERIQSQKVIHYMIIYIFSKRQKKPHSYGEREVIARIWGGKGCVCQKILGGSL